MLSNYFTEYLVGAHITYAILSFLLQELDDLECSPLSPDSDSSQCGTRTSRWVEDSGWPIETTSTLQVCVCFAVIIKLVDILTWSMKIVFVHSKTNYAP